MAPRQTKGKPSMRDEIAALKRERVIEAAVDLFYERGIENATLDDVADRLGVSKPFIYMNFGSKPELLAEICRRGVLGAMREIDAALALDLPPARTLEVFARRYIAIILELQKYIAVYVREEKNLDQAEAKKIGEIRRVFFGKIAGLLRKGAASGDFDIEDPDLAALAIGGAVTWATFWYRPGGRLAVEDIIERMTRQVLALAGARANVAGATRPAKGRRAGASA